MSAKHTPGPSLAEAHMTECRHQQHANAVQWRKLWHSLHAVGIGRHPDADHARAQMRRCVAAARHYQRGRKHYAAIAKATGSAS